MNSPYGNLHGFFSDCFVAKVSDFGLSLRIYQERAHNVDNNDMKKKFRFPIRWMSPEFLNHATSSEMSDVWSYAILLWEIFELALKQPYGVKGNFFFVCGIRWPLFLYLHHSSYEADALPPSHHGWIR